MSPADAGRVDGGYRHLALLYEATEELVRTGAAFLRDGLEAGEVPVLMGRPETNARVQDALGQDPRLVVFDRGSVYSRAANGVSTQRRLVRDHLAAGATRVRVLGEVPVQTGSEEPDDWLRYEAALNVGLAELPCTGACAYDVGSLPVRFRHGLARTHPYLLEADGAGAARSDVNPRYVDPRLYLRTIESEVVDPVESTTPTLELSGLTDLHTLSDVRTRMHRALAQAGIAGPVAADFVKPTSEVIVNALLHGRPPVLVRLWAQDRRLVCTVTDRGPGFDDVLLGYAPPEPGEGRSGTGLWLARQMCDRLDTSRRLSGFTVRLTTHLHQDDRNRLGNASVRSEVADLWAQGARRRADELRRQADQLERRWSGTADGRG